jgi:hypothetical protein
MERDVFKQLLTILQNYDETTGIIQGYLFNDRGISIWRNLRFGPRLLTCLSKAAMGTMVCFI